MIVAVFFGIYGDTSPAAPQTAANHGFISLGRWQYSLGWRQYPGGWQYSLDGSSVHVYITITKLI